MMRPLPDEEPRIHKVSIYLSQSEFDQLESFSGGNKSKFIVDAMYEKLQQQHQGLDSLAAEAEQILQKALADIAQLKNKKTTAVLNREKEVLAARRETTEEYIPELIAKLKKKYCKESIAKFKKKFCKESTGGI